MRYLFFCLLVMALTACQKEIGFADGSDPSVNSNVKCTGCSYLPVCDSTKLTYRDSSAAGVDTLTSTLVILGDTTINGKKFTKVSPSGVFAQGLVYNCDGGEYKVYQAVPDLGLNVDSLLQGAGFPGGSVTIPSRIQTTILKANAATGATWSDVVFQFAPIPLITITASLDYKLESKGGQRTVLGKAYSNVIHVSSKLNIAIPLTPSPVDLRIDTWYADGIGVIETQTSEGGLLQSSTKLMSYKIK